MGTPTSEEFLRLCAGKTWDKIRGKVGQMRLSGLTVQTAPDSVVIGPEVPLQGLTGPDRVGASSFGVTACPNKATSTTGKEPSQTGPWQARQHNSMSRQRQAGQQQVRPI